MENQNSFKVIIVILMFPINEIPDIGAHILDFDN